MGGIFFGRSFGSLCTPAKIQAILILISLGLIVLILLIVGAAGGLGAFMVMVLVSAIPVVIALGWIWILDNLCKADMEWLSWILVVVPLFSSVVGGSFINISK